jgi:hypothetical protein
VEVLDGSSHAIMTGRSGTTLVHGRRRGVRIARSATRMLADAPARPE